MAKYGKTFWGGEWLNALSEIDDSNRLPRGSAYASRGAVRAITITGGDIRAKVQGSRPKPYDVTITVPAFSAAQKKKLANILSGNAAWLATLLNRQLPAELLERARGAKISLFPRRWDDFAMQCSCPDWAVPCKHLAAVVYLIANDIDLNPMLVLELHGFDLVQELRERHMDVSDSVREEIPDLLDALESHTFAFLDGKDAQVPFADLSTLPTINERFVALLSPTPPFWHKDFREVLLSHFRFARKRAQWRATVFSRVSASSLAYPTCIDARLVLDHDLDHPQILLRYERDERVVDFFDWCAHAMVLPADQIERWCFPLRLLHAYTTLSVHLVTRGAMAPRLVRLGNHTRVEWAPLRQNDVVRNVLESLSAVCPREILLVEDGKKRKSVFPQAIVGDRLMTTMITVLLRRTLHYERRVDTQDAVTRFFFGASLYDHPPRPPSQSPPLSEALLRSIGLWLRKLHFTERDFVPVLQVHEDFPAFSLSLLVADRSSSSSPPRPPLPIQKFKTDKRYADKRMRVFQDVMLLCEHFPDLSPLVNDSKTNTVGYDGERFATVLLELLPVLQLLGVEVLLPKSLKHIVTPRSAVAVSTKGKVTAQTWMDLSSLLDFSWRVAVGENLMDTKEFLRLVEGMSGIVKLRDGLIHLGREDIAKLIRQLAEPPNVTRQDAIAMLFTRERDGVPIALSPDLQRLLDEWTSVRSIPVPRALLATLRPYQQRGYEWLYKNTRIGFGSILADDMGLGKTVQTIALLLKLHEERHIAPPLTKGKTRQLSQSDPATHMKTLVVVPTSLLTNWGRELSTFAPSLSYATYHGQTRNLNDFQDCTILLTSYGTVRRDYDILAQVPWDVLIVDEAQNIKNHGTDQTKRVKAIPAKFKIALSGTPVENRLSEYWSIADFANHGFLGSQAGFAKSFALPIQMEHDSARIDAFRKLTAPFILRRVKTDKTVISDLPDKIENTVTCALLGAQAALYERVVRETMANVERSDGIERRGLVLKMMTALKQVCNHPFQYLKEGLKDARGSGKLQLLFDLLSPMLEQNEKVLIFTQYKEMGDLLVAFLRSTFDEEPLFLHGSLTRAARDDMVHSFQHFAHHRLFILSLKAGGTGLNLTAARNVVHYDLWWNPAVEAQATDRAYRIGQCNNVMVYRLISRGTLEEKIDAMIQSKKELANLTVPTGEKWLGELSNTELKELVSLSDQYGER